MSSSFRLTPRAATDLDAIADYTIETFGSKQARRYCDALETCFQTIANNPKLGRSADQLAPELRRYEHQSHVVFYLPEGQDALIVRVLHVSRDFDQHL